MKRVLLRNKKGQTSTATKVVGGVIVAFVLLIGIVGLYSIFNNNVSPDQAFGDAIDDVTGFFKSIFKPLLGGLLNLDARPADVQFLMIVTFILIFIIVSATLDAADIFGEGSSSGILNFVSGIVVSAIGVRFLPQNMWSALTVPSSAFVATVLAGIVFIPLFILSVSAQRRPLVVLLGWTGYIIMFTVVIYEAWGKVAKSVLIAYIVFIILAIIMLLFNSSIGSFIRSAFAKAEVDNTLDDLGVLQRKNLREKIAEYHSIIADETASKKDHDRSKRKLKQLKDLYGDLSEV